MVHKILSFRRTFLSLVITALLLVGCSRSPGTGKREKKGPAPASGAEAAGPGAAAGTAEGERAAARPDVLPAPGGDGDVAEESPPAVAATRPDVRPPEAAGEIPDLLKKLKFKARREVVWVRGAISNIPEYRQSVARLDREAEEWKMLERIPEEPAREALQEELDRLAQLSGLTLEYREFKDAQFKRRKLPETIHGQKPFDFEDNDIRDIVQVVLRTGPAEPAALQEFLGAVVRADRLMVVRKVKPRVQERGYIVNLEAFWFPTTAYPIHVVEPRVLEEEMKRVGIGLSVDEAVKLDSVGYLQHASMSYREFNASLEELNGAMKLLSESKYKSARSEFFRRKSEEALRSVAKSL